ncbi:MAG: VOC family protein [Woeseiaceae bacterium]
MRRSSVVDLLLASLFAVAGSLSVAAAAAGHESENVAPGSQFDQDEEPDPLTLRRQTLIVRDMDKSLALYRDAIGMQVIYDNIIRRPHKTEDRQQEIRLVFLKANNAFIGVLGLVDYEHNNPSHPMHTKSLRKEGFTPGNSVLLFNTTELDERWPKIRAVPGVEVINGPTYTEYPSYDGSSIIRINVTRFYDPDGFLVEYNQPIDRMH